MIDFQKPFSLVLALAGFFGLFSVESRGQENESDSPKTVAKTEREPMFLSSYFVPPTFLGVYDEEQVEPVADPFGDPPESNLKPKKLRSAQVVLEEVGILFPPGSSAVFDPESNIVDVINTAEQLDGVDIFLGGILWCRDRQVYIFVEFVEVEAALYHDWMFENRITHDGTELRKQAQKWVKAGDATVVETSAVLARSGQRGRTESIRQIYYPTDFDPARIPNEVDLTGAETRAPISPVAVANFDRRNVGTTLEVDPVLGADNLTIEMKLAPEIVTKKGMIEWPPNGGDPMFAVSLSEFHTMKITTQLVAERGRYAFLGTTRPLKPADETRKRPLMMMFARGDVSNIGQDYTPFLRTPIKRK